MTRSSLLVLATTLTLLLPAGASAEVKHDPLKSTDGLPAQAESFPADSPRWQLGPNAKVTNYLGRDCLALEDEKATLKDFEITDGVIDVDMAGTETRGFYNISFRTQANGDGELVYLRAHKTGLDDAQQYSPMFKGVGPWQI